MHKYLIVLLLSFTFAVNARAQSQKKMGVGVLLGSPTALSGKYFISPQSAVDLGLSFSSYDFMLFGDFLQHYPGVFGRQNEFVARLTPYVGIGPIVVFNTGNDKNHHGRYFEDHEDDNVAIGGRIPLGVEWLAPTVPVGVSLEIVPGMMVIPSTDAFIQAGLAIRYYF